jgi:hypothetical protein
MAWIANSACVHGGVQILTMSRVLIEEIVEAGASMRDPQPVADVFGASLLLSKTATRFAAGCGR